MTAPSATTPAADPKIHLRWLAVAVFLGGLAVAGWQIWRDRTPDVRHPAILTTAWVSFGLWAGAVGLMIPAIAAEWYTRATRFRVAGWSWALGAAMFLIHFLVAFHFAHRWQHTNAIDHVTKTAGFSPGIFVSYLFTAVWLSDATWRVLWPTSYSVRPKWAGWSVHGFIAFITFNGTVVYVPGWIRWMAAGVFVTLGVALVWNWVRRRVGETSGEPRV